jgi:putative CocE/NonD family hydrolase
MLPPPSTRRVWPGPFPALLVRTPYGKDDAGTYGNPKLPDVFALVEAGYVVVAQDVRGTSRSPGTFVPHIHEGPDGLDALAWLADQSWCDGAVGMWGGSYMGFTQWEAAPHDAPALRAIAPVMSSADPYAAPWRSPGGALSQDAILTWGTLSALGNLRRDLADGHGDPADAQALLSGLSDPQLLHDPLPVADRGAVTRHLPWIGQVLDHPERDTFWREISAIDHCGRITVPALQIGGWYDVFIGETVRSYTMMRRHGGSAEARDGQRLLVGPWSHADGTDLGTYPDRSFGSAGSIKAAGVTEAHLRFFDRWVRGRTETLDDTHRVRIFVMGIDQWRDEVDWPLPDTCYTDFFLAGGGRANTAGGDGVLTRDAVPVEAPGTVDELTIDMCVTANVFLPGHCIRLEVSSSNFPRYDRNTNTGGTIATDGEGDLAVAVNRVHHGPARPSRLVLPLIERTDTAHTTEAEELE